MLDSAPIITDTWDMNGENILKAIERISSSTDEHGPEMLAAQVVSEIYHLDRWAAVYLVTVFMKTAPDIDTVRKFATDLIRRVEGVET